MSAGAAVARIEFSARFESDDESANYGKPIVSVDAVAVTRRLNDAGAIELRVERVRAADEACPDAYEALYPITPAQIGPMVGFRNTYLVWMGRVAGARLALETSSAKPPEHPPRIRVAAEQWRNAVRALELLAARERALASGRAFGYEHPGRVLYVLDDAFGSAPAELVPAEDAWRCEVMLPEHLEDTPLVCAAVARKEDGAAADRAATGGNAEEVADVAAPVPRPRVEAAELPTFSSAAGRLAAYEALACELARDDDGGATQRRVRFNFGRQFFYSARPDTAPLPATTEGFDIKFPHKAIWSNELIFDKIMNSEHFRGRFLPLRKTERVLYVGLETLDGVGVDAVYDIGADGALRLRKVTTPTKRPLMVTFLAPPDRLSVRAKVMTRSRAPIDAALRAAVEAVPPDTFRAPAAWKERRAGAGDVVLNDIGEHAGVRLRVMWVRAKEVQRYHDGYVAVKRALIFDDPFIDASGCIRNGRFPIVEATMKILDEAEAEEDRILKEDFYSVLALAKDFFLQLRHKKELEPAPTFNAHFREAARLRAIHINMVKLAESTFEASRT